MKFHIQFTERNLQNNAGLSIFSKFINTKQFKNVFKRHDVSISQSSKSLFSDLDIINSLVLLIGNGFTSFENIEHFKNDLIFKRVLGTSSIPSKETFRQRLDKISLNPYICEVLVQFSHFLLKKHATPKTIKGTNLIPLDFDVSVLDNTGSKKEGVQQTYKTKVKGYAPMFSYLGAQGYCINLQFRKGSAHSNTEGTLEFLIQTGHMARQICPNENLLIRLDSGNDSDKNIVGLTSIPNSYFIVKYQPRGRNVPELKQTLTEYVMKNYTKRVKIDNNAIRYFAEQKSIAKIVNDDDTIHTVECRRILSVVEITHDIQTGEKLLIPHRSLHMWRTNLPKSKYSAKRIIDLYKDHGTSEQFHSEFKSDLNIERLPSYKYLTNQLVLHVSQITFNILRIIGEKSIILTQSKHKRKRLRTVILKIIYTPCWFTRKNNKWTIFLPRNHPSSDLMLNIYNSI